MMSEPSGNVFKAPVVLNLSSRKIQPHSNVLEADHHQKDSKPKVLAAQLIPSADPHAADGDAELKLIAEALDREKKSAGGESAALGIPELHYDVPKWSGMPAEGYSLEILKNGAVIDNYDLTVKQFYLVGRLEQADLHLEHPSVSRCHAILQYRAKAGETSPPGFYIFDLDSTHGTFLNKTKLRPRQYVRLHVGHVIKFGGSTRLFVLEGPEADMEEEADLSVTQLKERAARQKEIMEGRVRRLEEKEQSEAEAPIEPKTVEEADEGISWGMNEDAQEEEKSEEEEELDLRKPMKLSFSVEQRREREKLYLDDPRKALRHFFEREGYEMEFVFTERNVARGAQWNCRIELPVEDEKGMPLWAEANVSGSKKDAQHQCALEACRKLDEFDYLRKKAVTKKRKSRDWQSNDFYDSDEDEFLDRTGQLEQKRKIRMKKEGKTAADKADTFQTLVEKLEKVKAEICVFEKELAELEKSPKAERTEDVEGDRADSHADALDDYMMSLAAGKDKPTLAATISTLAKKNHIRMHLADLNHQATRLRQLAHIAKPAILPELKRPEDKKKFPLVGSMKGGVKYRRLTEAKVLIKPPPIAPIPTGSEEVEVEEEEAEPMAVETVKPTEADMTVPPAEESESAEPSVATDETAEAVEPSQAAEKLPPKKHRHRGRGAKQPGNKSADYDLTADPNYAVWMPPENQSGDGKTDLNAKFGY